jgi:hypothetical protein
VQTGPAGFFIPLQRKDKRARLRAKPLHRDEFAACVTAL